MGEVINSPSRLDTDQKSIIRQGALDKLCWRDVHDNVSGIRPVTQKLVRELMEEYSTDLAAKSSAKAEGSALIKKFLENAREGVCASRDR